MTAPIVAQVPFRTDRNLGLACNEAMERVPDGGWGVLMDHDILLTTPHWFAQLEEAIACRPDAGAFAVVTNRIASPWQRAPEAESAGDDLARHFAIGEARRLKHRTLTDITCTKGYGGVLQCVSKDAWREAGGYADGLFCVDHSIFFRMVEMGRRIYLVDGLYCYHRRVTSSAPGTPVGKKWEACLCRGREVMPTERIALP